MFSDCIAVFLLDCPVVMYRVGVPHLFTQKHRRCKQIIQNILDREEMASNSQNVILHNIHYCFDLREQ